MSDYDTDILIWSKRQAALLRRRAAGELVNEAELDWSNIAEEIESLGNNQKRELASRIAAILLHLLKLAASPSAEPRAGWRETIREQRDELSLLLEDAPSLRSRASAVIAAGIGRARVRALQAMADYGEQPRVDVGTLWFTEDQVLGDWFPGDAP